MKELSDLKNARWEEIGRRLHQNQCAHHQVIEALRHLANAYKHDPRMEPDVKLLNHLRLDLNLRYAPIPESGKLQGGLATVVDLPADSSYPDIAASFVECVQGFLDDVEARNAISRVRGAGFHISTSDIDSRAFATNN